MTPPSLLADTSSAGLPAPLAQRHCPYISSLGVVLRFYLEATLQSPAS